MDRCPCRGTTARRRNPHARGDGPVSSDNQAHYYSKSPRAWGWTVRRQHHQPHAEEFPTRVGMDRPRPRRRELGYGNPHARGDGPKLAGQMGIAERKSPRAWGWTGAQAARLLRRIEIPTRVGMDRLQRFRHLAALRNPHARGDGPYNVDTDNRLRMKSPRAWGWTGLIDRAGPAWAEIPTRVGMDRYGCQSWSKRRAKSPRAWGWTAFRWSASLVLMEIPTRVGMDRPRRC